MHLLDTSVVSKSCSRQRNPAIAARFDVTARNEMFVSSVINAELLLGLAVMPAGRRQHELAGVILSFPANEPGTEVPGFGSRQAGHQAEVVAIRRRIGRRIGILDARFAAIARARGFGMVTRNAGDLEHCGVEIVNPCAA